MHVAELLVAHDAAGPDRRLAVVERGRRPGGVEHELEGVVAVVEAQVLLLGVGLQRHRRVGTHHHRSAAVEQHDERAAVHRHAEPREAVHTRRGIGERERRRVAQGVSLRRSSWSGSTSAAVPSTS